MIGAQPALGNPAAGERSTDAINDRDGTHHETGAADRKPGRTVQKGRNPVGDAAHGEGERGQAEGACQVGGIGEQAAKGGAVDGGKDLIAGAALGFGAEPAIKRGDQQAGNGANKKGRAPAPVRADLSSGQVAQGRAHRNRQIENGKNAVALALGIEVGEDGGSEDAETRLADAHQSLAQIEGPVAVDPHGSQRGQAPEDRAGDDERLARIAVSQPAGQGRRDHVEEKERRGQRAHLMIGCMKFALHQHKLAGKDVAVDVVQQVEADEQQQRPLGGGDAGARRVDGRRQGCRSGGNCRTSHQ